MRLTKEFYCRDVLEVAPELLGKKLIRKKGTLKEGFWITEVEAYRGEEDEACHARFGMTKRNRIMYDTGGLVYVYLVYGMYWMFNIVTGSSGSPQAVLIRGISGCDGPGKLTRVLGINQNHYGEDLTVSDSLWLEDGKEGVRYVTTPRIGISYAAEPWKSIPWRFVVEA